MLNDIKESCYYVWQNSKYVKINEEKLENLVKEMKGIEAKWWLEASPFGILDMDIDRLSLFLLLYEAMDYSFWGEPKWNIETEEGILDGSIALLYVFYKYFKKRNIEEILNLSKDEFYKMVEGNNVLPLREERYNNYQSVCDVIKKEYKGEFYQVIKEINEDERLLEFIIKNFNCFKDERRYRGKIIYFYKLAQLLTSDLLQAQRIKENKKVDISHLVGCADYKIPQVLRALGILEYNQELAMLIDNKKEIGVSDYEVEIRACMIVTIDKIKERLGDEYKSILINDYLFLQKNRKDLKFKPYHLTRCVNY